MAIIGHWRHSLTRLSHEQSRLIAKRSVPRCFWAKPREGDLLSETQEDLFRGRNVPFVRDYLGLSFCMGVYDGRFFWAADAFVHHYEEAVRSEMINGYSKTGGARRDLFDAYQQWTTYTRRDTPEIINERMRLALVIMKHVRMSLKTETSRQKGFVSRKKPEPSNVLKFQDIKRITDRE